MGDGTVRLEFEDGTDTVVDLVVGADGIRSVSGSLVGMTLTSC